MLLGGDAGLVHSPAGGQGMNLGLKDALARASALTEALRKNRVMEPTRPADQAPARDRDAAGRPRNARPRDGLGRPLPKGMTGVPTTPDDLILPPDEALREAQRLLDAGRPFHAHEVLEATWKAAGEAEREFWRGMAQLAVGLTHARRGNSAGAARLLGRAADRIAAYTEAPPHGVPVAALAAWARGTAERIGRGDQLDGRALTPTLVA